MKAPSPLCLQALRALAFPTTTTPSCRVPAQRRCYAALPDRPPPPPPPRSFKAPPPPQKPQYLDVEQPEATLEAPPKPSSTPLTKAATTSPPLRQPPPPATFRPTPSGPDLRRKRDDDEDFTPYPLTRPIGQPSPPSSTDNMGTDHRTLRQKRDDFHNYDKHLERRARMTKQIAKPYFRDWSNMRFFKGKVFVAPERLFRGEVALWFPNFFGRTLAKGVERRESERGDGYGGRGRGTTEVFGGRVSVVSIVGNDWAQRQVETFCSKSQNPELHRVLQQEKGLAQRVEINWESNWLKWWILQIFAVPNLRRSRSVEEQARYFMVRRGITDIMKEAIGLLNDKGGYVYLVDQECRIRWAGSAEATEAERESLVEGMRRLVREARTPREQRVEKVERKELLEKAVAEVVEEPVGREKAAAVG